MKVLFHNFFRSYAIKKTIWFLQQVLWTICYIYSYLSKSYGVVVWKQLKYSKIYRFQNISISDIYEWLQVRVLIHSSIKIGAYSWFGIFVITFYRTWIHSSDASAPNEKKKIYIYNWKYVVSDADKNNSVSPASMYDNFWYFHSDPLVNYWVSMHKNNWWILPLYESPGSAWGRIE